ncbi:putative Estradiol 17-beta-dehydrogenase 8 [Paratrimastix pyriformis]|uniref:3-oxoacyl-[acyl-carrier-protein] reductase n=1 Tax=Paratrimastix pyriformis TaxID=342808 RepID=A0ABQ8UT25_9EUKA|nr:putative Estradiol 17-beta-dehydrogenase 8 [Paratrimastix pyriformis]
MYPRFSHLSLAPTNGINATLDATPPPLIPAVGPRLAHKVCVVTGAASGIGRAIAVYFAKQGGDMALIDMNDEGLRETTSMCEAQGRRAAYFIGSVGSKADVDRMLASIITIFGTVDVLVNNAGISRDNLFTKMEEAQWDAVLNVNLKGVFLMSQAIAHVMRAKGAGSIVNISSIVGKSGNIGVANYGAAKAGVIGLTKCIAKEMGRHHVRCNCVLPGFVMTPLIANLPPKVMEAVIRDTPLGRLGEPEEIARACCFFASEDGSYCTGNCLEVAGGMFM